MYWHMDCAETREEKIYVILEILLALSGIVPYAAIILKRRRLLACIRLFEKLINERLSAKTKNVYENAERRSEFVAKWSVWVVVIVYDVVFPAFSFSIWMMNSVRGEDKMREWQSTLLIW